jgi:mgtE-like transporter
MVVFDKEFSEIFSTQMVSIIGGLVVGIILVLYIDKILFIPGMLILLPGFLEMRGNISGSFASRLSSGLFLGVINPKKKRTKLVRGNVFAALCLAVIVSFVLGIVAFAFSYCVFGVYSLKIIFIPVIAGIIANFIEIPLTLFMTFYLFRRGHDPNNIMGPFVTSTGDITSIVSLLVVMVFI